LKIVFERGEILWYTKLSI